MSSSIAIPQRKSRVQLESGDHPSSSVSFSDSSSFGSSFSLRSPSGNHQSDSSSTTSSSPTSRKSSAARMSDRRPSLLSESLSKSEYTVVNVGAPDAPRLITCVRKSQGFEWNHDIFLPSYLDRDFGELEHKQDPITDIILTEEEAAKVYPH